MKALIVDLKNEYAAALNEDGCVVQIMNMDYSLGQTVELYKLDHADSPSAAKRPVFFSKLVRRIGTIAASMVFVSGIGVATAYALPYGTVSLDGDSAVEYTINCFDYVLDAKALNEEGEELLDTMDMKQLRHHKISSVVSMTLDQLEADDLSEATLADISISAETKNEHHSELLQTKLEKVMQEDFAKIREDQSGQSQPIQQEDLNAWQQNQNVSQGNSNASQENQNAPQQVPYAAQNNQTAPEANTYSQSSEDLSLYGQNNSTTAGSFSSGANNGQTFEEP